MKFENIKVGDIVFTERRIGYSYNGYETFAIPEKVTRVTKTQFTVEGGDRYKKDGRKIGGYYEIAYFEGDVRRWMKNKPLVCDETEKMKAFLLKIKCERRFNQIAEQIRVETNSSLTHSELLDLIGKLTDVLNVIKDSK